MKRIIILTFILVLGYFLGGEIKRFTHPKKSSQTEAQEQVSCSEEETLESSIPLKKKAECYLVIANKGDSFKEKSATETENKLYSFFNQALKDHHEEPNEFNVSTNKLGPGNSAQKYDPREDVYVRFQFTKKYDKKAEYGVAKDVTTSVKSFLNSKKCSPDFNRIQEDDVLSVSTFLKKGFTFLRRPYELKNDHAKFSALYFFNLFFSMDADVNFISQRTKFVRNNCNKAISFVYNFCLVDPKYDLYYEDMFVFPDQKVFGSNIYCKKSSDSNWTLIKQEKIKYN